MGVKIYNSYQPIPVAEESASVRKHEQIKEILKKSFLELADVNDAFDIARTIKCLNTTHFALTELCKAYLKFPTIEAFDKAMGIIAWKKENCLKGQNVFYLVDYAAHAFNNYNTEQSLHFLDLLFKEYPTELASSPLKNQPIKAAAEAAPQSTPPRPTSTPQSTATKISSLLTQKAEDLFANQLYNEALLETKTASTGIKLEISLVELFEKCILARSQHSLECAYRIINEMATNRDKYRYDLFKQCKNEPMQYLGLKIATEFDDRKLRQHVGYETKSW